MKRILICVSSTSLGVITDLLSHHPACSVCYIDEDSVLDHLSRYESRGLEVCAVIVDELETARKLRRDMGDLGFETEVIEWRGDRREFEEELRRLL